MLPELEFEPEDRDLESLDRDSDREFEFDERDERLSPSLSRRRLADEDEPRCELGRLSITAPRSVSIFRRSRL